MALESLWGELSGAVTLAGMLASLPVSAQRGRLRTTKKNESTTGKEKEFGPPSYDDYMELWQGLKQVRASEHYGLWRHTKGVVTRPDVICRVASLCRRAEWRSVLEKKLIALALKRNEGDADRFYPGNGLVPWGKSTITSVECKKVLKYMRDMGLMSHGHPIFEHAHRPDVFARSFALQAGRPNESISLEDKTVVYEFYSLDVQQVLTEQGRYYLMKGCAEVRPNSKTGLAEIRIFQRWGPATNRIVEDEEGGPQLAMSEEYSGYLFLQDDIVYTLAFKANKASRGDGAHDVKFRRNMVSLVLSGYSRDADGFHRKLTGGQIGQGIGGAVGVLSAPCVFYRVGEERLEDLRHKLQRDNPQAWTRLSDGRAKDSVNYEVLKADSGFIDIISGVDQRYALVMADLNVPLPPINDEEGGREVTLKV